MIGAATVGMADGLSLTRSVRDASDFPLVANGSPASIVFDGSEAEVVRIAADLLASDVDKITGVKPRRMSTLGGSPEVAIIAGTIGQSSLVDRLVKEGRLKNLEKIRGRWEATSWQLVSRPFPGIEKALVIVGSDRRGTAYGLTRLSETIGVSPWTWWADVPPPHQGSLIVRVPKTETDAPAVKYRGIFINDEDWGLHQWASKTFEPETKGIGPKTYQRVFELMLRLRLNYLWPAMHPCTREFHLIPENVELAHRYAIVAGASHCEPMLFNNAKWDTKRLGPWDYALNRDKIYSTWEHEAQTRGDKEAVWTMGIRGIHDQGMQGPPDTATRIGIVDQVFRDQRGLLDKYVSKAWGPVAQCFVPYKEVLPLYDAGLNVPDDITVVWVDDNFGYIRRLGSPQERKRSGGAGVYWHLSYYGFPHSYTWINTTAPALIWEELHKAWENDARNLWVVNVGDIKPMEVGIDYFSKLAWSPEAMLPDSQPRFLRSFAAQQFGKKAAGPIARLLEKFYHLGAKRKPELMNREWAVTLPSDVAEELGDEYRSLLGEETRLSASIPPELRDAYFEIVGFPARILAETGLIFMADRDLQLGTASADKDAEISLRRANLEKLVATYNNETAGGKWKNVMPGLVTASNLTAWNSQVRWPWGEKPGEPTKRAEPTVRKWRDAASANRRTTSGAAKWMTVDGLGPSGRAVALKPASLKSSWNVEDKAAPTLNYEFSSSGGTGEALIDFLPSFRISPGMQLRVVVTLDDREAIVVEVPGSSGKEDENGPNRKNGVQNNFVRARVALPSHSAGKHILKIRAIDPGIVIDQVSLPEN